MEPTRSRIREPFNALSHLVGAILLGLATLILILLDPTSPVRVTGFLVFGLAGVLLFASSAAYHWAPATLNWLRRLDHSAIYVMIAGTYTPISLLVLPAPQKWWILALQWILATIGVVVSATREKTPSWLRLSLYLVMGWMVMGVFPAFVSHANPAVVGWLFAGGLAYTAGAVVYAIHKPDPWPQKFGFHGLWHLFVLGGAGCHLALMFNLA